MNVWIVPGVNPEATANVYKTLAQPISAERLRNAGLPTTVETYAWGPPKGGGERSPERVRRMRPGDPCLFYTRDDVGGPAEFRWAAQFLQLPDADPDRTSAAFWDSSDFIPYLLSRPQRIHLTREQMSQVAGYQPGWRPQGFNSLGDEAVQRIEEAHGSIESWLETLAFNAEPFFNDDAQDSNEVVSSTDGRAIQRYVTTYERNTDLRRQAIAIHGTVCSCCGFDFGRRYGPYAAGFIHIHHTRPVHEGEQVVNPKTDLAPVCPNCHAVIHRRRGRTLSIHEVRDMLRE